MAVASYNSKVQIHGTGVAVTQEAAAFLSGSGTTKIYQVTTSARRIWDPNVGVTVKVGATYGAAVAKVEGTDFTFDYLNGKVRWLIFNPGTDSVFVDGTYLPLLEVVTAYSFSLSMKAQLEESTVFKTTDNRTRVATLVDITGSISLREDGAVASPAEEGQDYDSDITNKAILAAILLAGTVKVLEFTFGSSGRSIRLFCLLEKQDKKASVDSLVNDDFDFSLTSQANGKAGSRTHYSFDNS